MARKHAPRAAESRNADRPPSNPPSPNWGDTPSMIALVTKDRYDPIPEELRTGASNLKGHSGIFVGRRSELGELHRFFDTDLPDLRDQSRAPGKRFAATITNAPGAGKSALIEEFAAQQAERGVACLPVGPEMLGNDEKFVSSITSYVKTTPSGVRRKRLQRTADALEQPAVAVGAGAAVEALTVGFTFGLAGSSVAGGIRLLQKAVSNLRSKWSEKPPANPKDALQQLSQACENGFIITVDECTTLADPSLDRRAILENLRLIADPAMQSNNGICSGLLMAGLGSTPDIADDLGLSRARTIWPGGLTQGEAWVVIASHLIEMKLPKQRKQRLVETWAWPLAATFHSWPQHTALAADIASWVARHGPRDVPDETQLEWVMTLTAKEVTTLYAERCDAAKSAAGPMADRLMVALANLYDNYIPVEVAEEVIARAEKRRAKRDGRAPDVKHALRAMREAGLWRRAITPGTFVEDSNHCGIPMPNLRRFVTEQTGNAKMAKAHKTIMKTVTKLDPTAPE